MENTALKQERCSRVHLSLCKAATVGFFCRRTLLPFSLIFAPSLSVEGSYGTLVHSIEKYLHGIRYRNEWNAPILRAFERLAFPLCRK